MKQKKQEICIRVSLNEKKKLQKKAQKIGLSLSAYLRKVGLEKEIYSTPKRNLYTIYIELNDLQNSIYNIPTKEKIFERIERIKRDFIYIYNQKNDEEIVNGNDKNMGS